MKSSFAVSARAKSIPRTHEASGGFFCKRCISRAIYLRNYPSRRESPVIIAGRIERFCILLKSGTNGVADRLRKILKIVENVENQLSRRSSRITINNRLLNPQIGGFARGQPRKNGIPCTRKDERVPRDRAGHRRVRTGVCRRRARRGRQAHGDQTQRRTSCRHGTAKTTDRSWPCRAT